MAGEQGDRDAQVGKARIGPAQLSQRGLFHRYRTGGEATPMAFDVQQRRAGRAKAMAGRGAFGHDDVRSMAGRAKRHRFGERARGLAHGQPLTEVLSAQRALAASRSAFARWISAMRRGTTTAATSATAAQARRRHRLTGHPLPCRGTARAAR